MPSCCLKSCKNWHGNCIGKRISFFRFPQDPILKEKWIEVCNLDRNAPNLKDGIKEYINKQLSARVCSVHFAPEYFLDTSHLCVGSPPELKLNKKVAVPTVNLTATNSSQLTGKNLKRKADESFSPDQENIVKKKCAGNLKHPVTSQQPILSGSLKRKADATSKTSYPKRVCVTAPLNILSVQEDHCYSSLNVLKDTHNQSSRKYSEESQVYNVNSCMQREESFPSDDASNIGLSSYTVLPDTTNHSVIENQLHASTDSCIPDVLPTQSNEVKSANSFVEENRKLKAENEKLKKLLKIEQKQQSKKVEKVVYDILSPIFTTGQIKKLLHPERKKVMWKTEDIATAIALRSVSPKGYRYLRKRKFPLPAMSTLRKWAVKVKIEEGVIESVIQLMESKAKAMKTHERICTLCFDEIYCSQNIEIDRKEEQRVGPNKTVQVGMCRGLFSKWKQPVFFDFDQPLTFEIVSDIIGKLYDAGYTVVNVTTDLGPTNSKVWSSQNIGIEENQNCYFAHPKDPSLKVFVMADPPHLLKLIRNHYVDSGFKIGNVFVGKEYIDKMLLLNISELNIIHKLERLHLDATRTDRQKVYLAAQLLSNKVAKAIQYCGDSGFFEVSVEGENNQFCYDAYQDCAQMIQTVNDWFDVLNSKAKYDANDLKCAYGVHLEAQNKVLEEMSHLMDTLRVGSYKTLLPFQKGIILTNKSLQHLLPYLQEKYSSENFQISYIFTNRLCQDVLENFFSYIRGMGNGHDKPSALQFKYRLRWYILGKHSADMLTESSNTEEDGDSSLIDSVDFSYHGSETDVAMREVMDSLYDEEMVDLADEDANLDQVGENLYEPEY